MKAPMTAISRTFARTVLKTKANSPTLMFGAGIVAVAAGTLLACRATLKLEEVISQSEENLKTAHELHESGHLDYSDRDYMQDRVMITTRQVVRIGKLYAPAIIVGGAGVALLTGSHHMLNKRNVALTAAYAGLEKTYKAYRERVGEEVGEERERELHYEAQTRVVEADNTVKLKVKEPYDHSIYSRFFDESNQNWKTTPEYNMLFLKCQQTYANNMLHARGHVFLNEVYDMIGTDRSKAGSVVGWVLGNGDDYIDFGIFHGRTIENRNFVNNAERSILLDFNVDGVIYDKI